MNNTEFKKIVQEITSKYGFMYCKKNYYYNSDKIIVVINLQKSNFDNSYYINYGFYVKDIHNDLQYPKNNECDITGRFLNETNKDKYKIDKINDDSLLEFFYRFIARVLRNRGPLRWTTKRKS